MVDCFIAEHSRIDPAKTPIAAPAESRRPVEVAVK
jgi:hypothetical protein